MTPPHPGFALRLPLLAAAVAGLAAGCAGGAAGRGLATTPHLEVLTPEQVFARAPAAEWREPTFGDPARAPVEVACGVSPRLQDGSLYAAVRVAGRTAEAPIAPLNVSLVLDRSGSMRGAPFQNMLLAAETFTGQLRDGDRLSIVVFSDGVFQPVAPVELTPESRGVAIGAIRTLASGGMTNLSGGLLAGLFDVWGVEAGWRVNQVVLLSDGQPNRGITDRRRLAELAAAAAERGVGVTSVGFGPEHDELLMQAIADAGGGTYHYVATAADIPAVFQREAAGMLTVAARDTVVRLDVPAGLVVEDVLGQDYYADRGRVWVRLGAVPHEEERYLVLRLRAAGATARSLPIAVVGSDMARRARFGLACQPAVAGGGGGDRWVLELAGRAEANWGLTEAMAWADQGSEPYVISQIAHTRRLLAGMGSLLAAGAFAEEDRALADLQGRLVANLAVGAMNATSRRGLGGLLEFGLNTAANSAAQAAFHPLVRAAVQVSWYGRPAQYYSARIQRPFKLQAGDRNRANKQARYDAYVKMRSAGKGSGSGPRLRR